MKVQLRDVLSCFEEFTDIKSRVSTLEATASASEEQNIRPSTEEVRLLDSRI